MDQELVFALMSNSFILDIHIIIQVSTQRCGLIVTTELRITRADGTLKSQYQKKKKRKFIPVHLKKVN